MRSVRPRCLALSLFASPFFSAALPACCTSTAQAESAYVRVSQVGYEASATASRAYLMSTVAETGATFKVVSPNGKAAYSGKVGALLAAGPIRITLTRSTRSTSLFPRAQPIRSPLPAPSTPVPPTSPSVPPDVLYPGLLVNALFFYQTPTGRKRILFPMPCAARPAT